MPNRRTQRPVAVEPARLPIRGALSPAGEAHEAGRGALSAAVEVAKALAHPARIRLLGMLEGGELCSCQLAAAVGLAQSTVSAHMAELRRAGLVDEEKRGRWVYSRLARAGAPAALAGRLLDLAASDPQIEADRTLVAELRRHAPEDLCRVGGDLVALGVFSGLAET
jgi:ArsR family transcriptional regulator, arsenate/arsenite/antimonite-responsive transcriptional repressor